MFCIEKKNFFLFGCITWQPKDEIKLFENKFWHNDTDFKSHHHDPQNTDLDDDYNRFYNQYIKSTSL